jgi:UDP-N-acetylmuramate dehydrogenase
MEMIEKLAGRLDPAHTKRNEPLVPYTTLGIGGPADLFFEAGSASEIVQAVTAARELGVPVTMLGGGSNVLVSDAGIRGLVIHNRAKKFRVLSDTLEGVTETGKNDVRHRWQPDTNKGTFKYDFKDLDYDESGYARVDVAMESGTDLLFAANQLMNRGITGLQWYAGIPGTVGGAVFNNIHGGSHFIHEVLRSVKILTSDGAVSDISMEDGAF